MSELKDAIPALVEEYKSLSDTLDHNHELFEIYEGNLMDYVLADLQAQLSEKSYEQAKYRVAPINVVKRVIDKLSKIYARTPVREFEGGSDADLKLWNQYEKSMELNTSMAMANEFFNLHKYAALEPYKDRGKARLRILPADRFFVYSDDTTNPLRPTHFVKIMGKQKLTSGVEKMIFYGYTDNEFLVFDEDRNLVPEIMDRPGIRELGGQNPYGKIPFVYLNRSKHDLIPANDSDMLAMTKLIPVLLSDLNYAVMFQCFSIVYGIDVKSEGLNRAPNAFWELSSDKSTDKTPELGVIKPQVDIDQVIGLIKSQLAFWMQTRNIKPGAIGDLSPDTAASGISKMIDEMDTSEDRQKQIPYFMDAEQELAELITQHIHPVWSQDPDFELRGQQFSNGLKLNVKFAEQRPIVDSSKAIDDQDKLIQMGLQSKRGALKELYPDWTEKQIDERLAEVETEQAEHQDQMQAQANSKAPMDNQPKDQMMTAEAKA